MILEKLFLIAIGRQLSARLDVPFLQKGIIFEIFCALRKIPLARDKLVRQMIAL